MLGRGDGPTSNVDLYRRVHDFAHGVDRIDGLRERTLGRHAHADRGEVDRVACRNGERISRQIGTEVVDLPATLTNEVGNHRHRQRMALTLGGADENCTARATTTRKTRPEAAHDAGNDRTRTVFEIDLQFTARPLVADADERRTHDVGVDLVKFGTCSECGFDDAPCTTGITGKETQLEPLGPRRALLLRLFRVQRFTRRRTVTERFEVFAPHAPRSTRLRRLQQAQPHVAVCRHVVNVKQVSRFLQTEFFAHDVPS